MSSARIPLLSLAFTFLEAINGSLYFILCVLWYFISHVIIAAFLPVLRWHTLLPLAFVLRQLFTAGILVTASQSTVFSEDGTHSLIKAASPHTVLDHRHLGPLRWRTASRHLMPAGGGAIHSSTSTLWWFQRPSPSRPDLRDGAKFCKVSSSPTATRGPRPLSCPSSTSMWWTSFKLLPSGRESCLGFPDVLIQRLCNCPRSHAQRFPASLGPEGFERIHREPGSPASVWV